VAPDVPRPPVPLTARRSPATGRRSREAPRARAPVALTGTPGTGKSTVAALLGRDYRVVEVGALALSLGAGRHSRNSVLVDLVRLRAAMRRRKAEGPEILVGHLAHLLPVRAAIVLRCRPLELDARLRRRRQGTARERDENVVSEATDLVLREALDQGLTVFEVDTTGRKPEAIARELRRWLASRRPSRYGGVDWLGDPAVTEHLLERTR
jgi:adenylate kinase